MKTLEMLITCKLPQNFARAFLLLVSCAFIWSDSKIFSETVHSNMRSYPSDPECGAIRGAFDIGSGSTKVKLALVDICLQKIKFEIYSNGLPVAYQVAVSKNSGMIDLNTLRAGRKAILKLQASAQNKLLQVLGKNKLRIPIQWRGFATSAFRKAKNGKEAIRYLSDSTSIKFEVISQSTEARLGYFGALSQYSGSTPTTDLVVWDIGGGSMQFTYQQRLENGTSKILDYKGDIASVTFRNHIIESIQGKKLSSVQTPNPIGEKNAQKAVTYSKEIANTIDPKLMLKIKAPETEIIGIGGVHFHSLLGRMKKLNAVKPVSKVYSLENVEKLGKILIKKSDFELESRYASTDASNFLLIQGFMEALSINSITVLPINITDGALVYPDFY